MDKTLLKGLMVLEAVTDVENQPKTIDELAARVGLTRSNTHRTLQTLVHAGYVIKDEEITMIREKITASEHISKEHFDKNFQEVMHVFRSHNDFTSLQYIENECSIFNLGTEERQKLYKDIEDIIKAQDEDADVERINMLRFKKMLGV